jgi:hypothetical protein
MGKDEGHDNSEYAAPTARTGAQPPPTPTFVPEPADDVVSSDAAFRQDIRDGLSDEEAMERAQERAAEAREGGKKKK